MAQQNRRGRQQDGRRPRDDRGTWKKTFDDRLGPGLERRQFVSGYFVTLRVAFWKKVDDVVQSLVGHPTGYVALITIQVTKSKSGGVVRGLPIHLAVNSVPFPKLGEPLITDHQGRAVAEEVPVQTSSNLIELWVRDSGDSMGGIFFVREERAESPTKKKTEEIKEEIGKINEEKNLLIAEKSLADLKEVKKPVSPVIQKIILNERGEPGDYIVEVRVSGDNEVGSRRLLITHTGDSKVKRCETSKRGLFIFRAKFKEVERRYRVVDEASGKEAEIWLYN